MPIQVEFQAYHVAHRPHHDDSVVINRDLLGLATVSLATGDVVNIVYPDEAEHVIVTWCMRADGDAMIVFTEDGRACLFDLQQGQSRWIGAPAFEVRARIPYDWRGDTLWIRDLNTRAFARSERGGDFIETPMSFVSMHNTTWRQAIRVLDDEATYLGTTPELGQLAYRRRAANTLGTTSWLDQPVFEVVCPVTKLGRVVAAGDRLLVLAEYEAVMIGASGEILRRIPAPEGHHYSAADYAPASRQVLLLCSPLDGSSTSCVLAA